MKAFVLLLGFLGLTACQATVPTRDEAGNYIQYKSSFPDLALCAMDAGIKPPYKLKGSQQNPFSLKGFDSYYMEYSKGVQPEVVDQVNQCAIAKTKQRGGAPFTPISERDCIAVYHAKLAENQFRNSQSLPIATGNFWVDVFAKGLVEGIDGHKRDKAFRQCQKTAGLSLTHTPKNNDLAGVKKPDGTLHPISLTPLGQRVKYNNANQDTQTPKAEKKAQAPLAVEVNLDQPMQSEVHSDTPVVPAKPAVATSTKNICPPGAPILYRGNMTCPDRF